MREDKTELRARVYLLERERESLELKLATLQSQQQAYMATVQHLQAQLHDNETGVSCLIQFAGINLIILVLIYNLYKTENC